MKSNVFLRFGQFAIFGGISGAQLLYAQTVFMDGSGHLDMQAPLSAWTPPNDVNGARFLWYPDKYALRFGLSSADWNNNNIGMHSFAGGQSATASGIRSFTFGGVASEADTIALGTNSQATAQFSSALGPGSGATGTYSVAIGGGENYPEGSGIVRRGASAYGSYAIAIGRSSGAGEKSLAIGADSHALTGSTAIGYQSFGIDGSLAISAGPWASNASNQSIAFGYYAMSDTRAIAIGPYAYALNQSVSIGNYANAYAPGSVALGISNDFTRRDGSSSADGNAANLLDPIFSIGNGTFEFDDLGNIYETASSAFTVYRDGVTRLTGSLQIPKTTPYIEVYDPANPAGSNLPKLILPTTTSGSFSFSADSKIGVGTTSPSQIIHVVKASNTLIEIQSTATGANNTGLTLVTPDRTWNVGSNINGTGAGRFSIYDASVNVSRLTIDTSGNVGIGTTTPSAKLEVNGTVTVVGTITAKTSLRTPPAGDLSMGIFTAGSNPATE